MQLFCTSVSYKEDAVFVSLHYIHSQKRNNLGINFNWSIV